jgi:hypothetical protein
MGLTVYPPKSSKTGFCQSSSSAGSSKIKIRTSSCNKPKSALLHDEVQILIFDEPAEHEDWQVPKFCFIQLDSTHFARAARARAARLMKCVMMSPRSLPRLAEE